MKKVEEYSKEELVYLQNKLLKKYAEFKNKDLHLDMSRNLNLPELLTGDILPVEVRTPEPWIFRIRKFPRSVQAYPSASLRMCLLLLIIAVPSVI